MVRQRHNQRKKTIRFRRTVRKTFLTNLHLTSLFFVYRCDGLSNVLDERTEISRNEYKRLGAYSHRTNLSKSVTIGKQFHKK